MAALSISRAWDETKAVLKSDGGLLAAVALALFVLPGVLVALVTPAAAAGQVPPVGYWSVLSIVALLISLIGQLAVVRLALGPRVSVGEAIAHGARRAPSYIGAAVLWFLPFLLIVGALLAPYGTDLQAAPGAVLVGILALSVIGIFVAVRLILASSVASAERIGPVGILKRSWALSRGNWWRLFGTLMLFVILFLIVSAAVGAVLGSVIVLVFGPAEPFSVTTLIIALITQLVSAALTTILMVLLARVYAQLSGQQQNLEAVFGDS